MTTTTQIDSHEKAHADNMGADTILDGFKPVTRQGLAGNIQLTKLADSDNNILRASDVIGDE